ncbi:hypothetical protein GUITHDRAFT_144162 [Guillardia theta CCMP2712]|uniref:Uncharacterized protein n=1 Tax=Guillardia theta (strain CCMP2712) TaxID=905079 RepID=L1IRN4_GUITC|nr:hypothetical protein GUITHDRAFT_144162 [Guillardia theta CCMP2712]EKX38564.1 hypothetical protein GUITHDRAFT_144162 [Guillardia theta CCMP2712]|eukprot:XP_005825544.1 hypothetical protein GUITHDRAFT_144162 [Guillardia theta CCMP2712]
MSKRFLTVIICLMHVRATDVLPTVDVSINTETSRLLETKQDQDDNRNAMYNLDDSENVREIKRFLAERPKKVEPRFWKKARQCFCVEEMQCWGERKRQIRKCKTIHPTTADGATSACLKTGEQEDESAKVENTQIFLDALQMKPNDVDILFNFAQYLTRSGKGDDAITYFDRILQLDPTHYLTLDRYATLLDFQGEKLDKAQEMYQGAMLFADTPQSQGMVCANFAQFCFSRKKDIEGAKQLYMKAISLDPEKSQYLTYLALVLQHDGDYDVVDICVGAEAEKYFSLATGLQQSDLDSLNAYAMFLESIRGDLGGAEECYRRAFENDDKHVPTLVNFAHHLHTLRKDNDLAEIMYKRALSVCPTNINALTNYGFFLATVREDDSSANHVFKAALQLDPTNDMILLNMADLTAKIAEDYSFAESLYRQALQINPTNIIIINNLGQFLHQVLQRIPEAEEMFIRALSIQPAFPVGTRIPRQSYQCR